jgi:hypothetical protein
MKREWRMVRERLGAIDEVVNLEAETLDFRTLLVSVEAVGVNAAVASTVSTPEIGAKGTLRTIGVPTAGQVLFAEFRAEDPIPPYLLVIGNPGAGGRIRIKVEGELYKPGIEPPNLFDQSRS